VTDSGVRASIIVPSFRRADSLERLVASLLPQLADRPDRELIVVDDASNDPAYPALAARYPGQMRLVTQPKNAGPSAARNEGARIARGEYLIFTDDDCVAPPYWLDWFDNIVTQNPDVDLIGGYARPLPHVKRWTPTRWAPFQFLQLGIWYNDEIVVLCSSCHLAVRKRWYERIGGFREQMRWAEDRNLTYRLRRAGAIIYTDEGWHLYHESEATLRQHIRRRIGYGRGAFDQIAREWPALDQADWPAEGSFLSAIGPRVRRQWEALGWYRKRARREKKWAPGYALMAAITPLAMDVGYIRARQEHARRTAGKIGTAPFALVNFGGSGSTVLGDMLHQCPGLEWGYEPFNPQVSQTGLSKGYELLHKRLNAVRTTRFGFEAVVEQIEAQGMTPGSFIEQASADGVGAWVLLTRRNLLRQHISILLADRSGRYHEQRADFWRPTDRRTLRLDVAKGASDWLVTRFRQRETDIAAVREALKGRQAIELVYEDDVERDPRAAIARLTPFLQLPDYDPVVRYQPVEPCALAETIENFAEVASVLEKTEFAWMLKG
jgi:GT2 family glycosyltransferase